MDASINSSELQSDLASGRSPLVIDVRKSPAFHAASDMIAGALRRDPARVSAWAKELPRRFLHALNYCMMLPGPEATQLAAYIGWMMHKTRGGIIAAAVVGVIL